MRKILFIDRDGTIIKEPEDFQIDSLEKLELVPGVIPALLELQEAGYSFVMISNQDGLGTDSFPTVDFEVPHNKLIDLLSSQGINFLEQLICPHFESDNCNCRKPRVGLVVDYLRDPTIDFENSFVIGDRESDLELAKNMKVGAFQINQEADSGDKSWKSVVKQIKGRNRVAQIIRTTKETSIDVSVDLDSPENVSINSGLNFFDHMLEQIAKHANIGMRITVDGDTEIDDHHTIEDTGLALGSALNKALSDRYGIGRYGFSLPMDEASSSALIDLSGRPYFKFSGNFSRETIGDVSTEMLVHFFKSLSETLRANIHLTVDGENCHHQVESMFKAFARALRQGVTKSSGVGLPSTKGVL